MPKGLREHSLYFKTINLQIFPLTALPTLEGCLGTDEPGSDYGYLLKRWESLKRGCVQWRELKGSKLKHALVINLASGGCAQSLKGKVVSPKELKQSCAPMHKHVATLHSRWWAYKVVICGFLFKQLIRTPVGLLCKH